MFRRIFVIARRVAVFMLIAVLAWFTAFGFFPFVDSKLPFLIAVLVTYAFLAYAAIPALLRIRHLLQPPTHVPTRTIAADGWAVDPINIVLLARNEKDVVWAMQKAGWQRAEERTLKNQLRLAIAVLFNKPYPTAPFGSYYVFGRKQDLGFQIPLGNSPRHRHHVRFWRLGTTLLEDEHEHHTFWRTLLGRFTSKEKQVWVGAAILDRGIGLRRRNLQLDHSIDSDTTIERDFLVDTLKEAHTLRDYVDIKAGEPLHTRHQGFGETIIADGYVKLCDIKRQILPPPPPDPPTI